MASAESEWLPLLDYAMKTGLSLSTLRRYIKANRIKYRVEKGRYLIWNDEASRFAQPAPKPAVASPASQNARPGEALGQSVLHKLQMDLQRAKEEIAELKTLIAYYEERMSRASSSRDL